jgi:O-6-methylguanine DNA methyltransferase
MGVKSFDQRVFLAVQHIPRGKVTSYKELAKVLGSPKLARAVGQALKRNKRPIKVPCHRVIASNFSLGGYSLGVKKKRELLEREGVVIINNKLAFPRKNFIYSSELKKLVNKSNNKKQYN